MRQQTSTGLARIVNGGTTACVLLAMAIMFSTPLRSRGSILSFAQDDFYYYLVVARNLAHGLGSTFDGTTPTNGYHPLYLLVLWAACKITTGIRGIYKLLAVLDTLSAVTIFLAARAFFARRLNGLWLTNGFALFVVFICRLLICLQMEVTLTFPLAVYLLLLVDRAPEEITRFEWARIGVVAVLMILSRLDSALLVAICGAVALASPPYRRALSLRKLAAFAAGFLPLLAAYLATNEVLFHRLMPISGAAKQLESTHRFAWASLRYSLNPRAIALFLAATAAIAAFPWIWQKLAKEQCVIYLGALLFPFVHWGSNLWLSDWQLWPWYTYSVRISAMIVLVLAGMLMERWFSAKLQTLAGLTMFAAGLLLTVTRPYAVLDQMGDIAGAAEAIRIFALDHPGRYAVGDRGGMVGYLDGRPTLQAEGLMMDAAYLEHIKRQDSLREVLKLYGVDYYIAFEVGRRKAENFAGECFNAKEPVQAGPQSPAMYGRFCEQPAFDSFAPSGRTVVFDLRGQP